jgi:excinuclease ABC subunit A
MDCISLRGARQNNLQGIDLEIPLGKLTVICGVSGSGKTSLALDTLYAEGQRRYIESFSAYSRQFLQRIDKPKFDSLTNLPPSIAITREQRSRNNRSTVGTASEMLEYLRIVFAKHATLHCHTCRRPVVSHTPKSILEALSKLPAGRAMIGFEIEWATKSELSERLFDLQADGFVRLIANGSMVHLADDQREAMAKKFTDQGRAFVVVDRIVLGEQMSPELAERLTQSLSIVLEQSDSEGRHSVMVLTEQSKLMLIDSVESPNTSTDEFLVDTTPYRVYRFSSEQRCEYCKIDYPASEPRLFSFNSPIGACESCEGFGETVSIDMNKVVPDHSLSLRDGAIAAWRTPAYSHELQELLALSKEYDIPVDVPVSKLKAKHWQLIREGVPAKNFGGLNGFFAWLERKKYKMHVRAFLARWRTYSLCTTCEGQRLSKNALSYRISDRSFADLCEMTMLDLEVFAAALTSPIQQPDVVHQGIDIGHPTDAAVCQAASSSYQVEGQGVNVMLASEHKSQYMASEPLRQVRTRIEYLQSVGLGYLTLSRPMHTLSSGEAQRVMMTTLLGSSLVDMLYVFDEPTVGLHPQDTERMANAILGLRDRGNTVVLVEHEPYLMKLADRIIEIGPKAGEEGGRVMFDGTPSELLKGSSTTSRYLRGEVPSLRVERPTGEHWIELRGATGRNLKSVDVRIPLGLFTVITGPSGSGKSTLLFDTVCPAIGAALHDPTDQPLPFEDLRGVDRLRACLAIDQSPIPRSSRSCPATYSKAMDDIRQVFASTPDAKSRNMGISHFSFNSETGRCPTCEGLGYTTVDMQFLADVQMLCTDCNGRRFQSDVLEVRYRDVSIFDVLQMSVAKAHSFFRGAGNVQSRLQPLMDLGLGYLPLGQSLASLSAGESMRLKLAGYLEAEVKSTGKGNMFVMDEPTTGLHFSDVDRLVQCINQLIDSGNTVVVIEHNQQLIESADYLIQLGPGAGDQGGKIIATGIARSMHSLPRSTSTSRQNPK